MGHRPRRRRHREGPRAGRPAESRSARGCPGHAAAVRRGQPPAEQRGRDGLAVQQRAPRGGRARRGREGRAGRAAGGHRAQPRPRPLRGVRRARWRCPRRRGCSAARQDPAGLLALRCRPGRGDPRPDHQDPGADDRGRPGVQQEHPRRHPLHPGGARAARRPARRLARGAPRGRRRAGHGDDRLSRLGADADVRARPRRTPRHGGRLPHRRLAAERRAAQGALRPAARDGQPGRLRRLGLVRRRREDDQEGSGDPGVHRQDRGGGRGADAARPRGAARRGSGRTSPTPR